MDRSMDRQGDDTVGWCLGIRRHRWALRPGQRCLETCVSHRSSEYETWDLYHLDRPGDDSVGRKCSLFHKTRR